MINADRYVEEFKSCNPSAGPTELKDAAAVGKMMGDWEDDHYHELGPGGMDEQQHFDVETACWAKIRKERAACGESEFYDDTLVAEPETESCPDDIDSSLHAGASGWRKPKQ